MRVRGDKCVPRTKCVLKDLLHLFVCLFMLFVCLFMFFTEAMTFESDLYAWVRHKYVVIEREAQVRWKIQGGGRGKTCSGGVRRPVSIRRECNKEKNRESARGDR